MTNAIVLLGYKELDEVYRARIDLFLEHFKLYDRKYVCGTKKELEYARKRAYVMELIGRHSFDYHDVQEVSAGYTYDTMLELAKKFREDNVEEATFITSNFHVPRTRILVDACINDMMVGYMSPETPEKEFHFLREQIYKLTSIIAIEWHNFRKDNLTLGVHTGHPNIEELF